LKKPFAIGPQPIMRDKKLFAWVNLAASPRVLVVLALLALIGCARSTPEQQLIATIERMEAAIEQRDSAEFMDAISEDFAGNDGQMDRRQLRGYLAAQMLGNNRVAVVLGPPQITFHGSDRATLRIGAVVSGGRLLPERVEGLTVESGWRLEGGQWHCYSADWSTATGREP